MLLSWGYFESWVSPCHLVNLLPQREYLGFKMQCKRLTTQAFLQYPYRYQGGAQHPNTSWV